MNIFRKFIFWGHIQSGKKLCTVRDKIKESVKNLCDLIFEMVAIIQRAKIKWTYEIKYLTPIVYKHC